MLSKRRLVRLRNGAAPAALALVAGLALVPPARADGANDPPTRVGRISVVQGTVSFHPSPDAQWDPAQLNYPVAQSTALWADSDGQAEIQLGEALIRLDHGTELDVVQLDDQNVILSVPQGRVDVWVHGMSEGERYDVQTPRGDVDLLQDGIYRVFAGDDVQPTQVGSIEGQAQLVGSTSEISVANAQEMVAKPGMPVAYSISMLTEDAFDASFRQQISGIVAHPVPAYVPPMPGVAVLSEYGAWREHPHYGHVWFPHVEAGWAPYRHGHWGYVAPWGYTWIDDAPWGFAPFHYGRWVEVEGAWGWIATEPGVVIQPGWHPCFAPAMVAFIGNPAALTVGLSVGGIGVSVGWVPLGPGEVFRPWYPVSEGYLRQANFVNVSNTTFTNIHNTTVINNVTYVNQRAATVVPQTAFAGGQPVQKAAYNIPAANLAKPIPLQPAQPSNIEKVLPPPARPAAVTPAQLPPATKLAMPHPAPASAAAFRAHPPAPATAPATAVPKAGTNAVPKSAVIAPRPATRPAPPPAKAAEQPTTGPAKPATPVKPGEPTKPAAEAPKPTEAPKPAEAAKPGEVAKPAQAPKPTEPAHPAEAPKPAAHPTEETKPAAHPAEAPKPEAHPAEAPKAAAHPAEEPKPAAHPAEAPKPAAHPAEEAKPAAHPAEEAKPAAHPAAEPAKSAPKPAAETKKPEQTPDDKKTPPNL